MTFDGRKFVVTGGSGFIGSHLVDTLLEAGAAKVAVVDNFFLGNEANLSNAQARFGDTLTVYREDAADANAMRAVIDAATPDVVFNLATKALPYSFFNPVGAATVNLDIATVLGESLRLGMYGRLVHVSTSEVYGSAKFVPMTEDHPLLAETPYAAGKAAADLFLHSYFNMFDLDIVTLRPFNNYGPRQNKTNFAAVIPLTIDRILNDQAPVITGDGLQTRDFIFVADTVRNILALAQRNDVKGAVFNVGSGRETSINDLVTAICKAMGYDGEIVYTEQRTADVRRHISDSSKFDALLGGLNITPLGEGIARTVTWYREHAGST